MEALQNYIIKPLLTEKSSLDGERFNRFGFLVEKSANKNQIKLAIEAMYDVKVLKVRTSVLPGKLKRAGRKVKKTNGTKKAFVELAEGQKIEFFKGV